MQTGGTVFGETKATSKFFSEEHDFSFKSKNVRKFIEDGAKVKITVRFRGREVNNVKLGEAVINKFIEELKDVATPEKKPLLEGRNMFVILSKKA